MTDNERRRAELRRRVAADANRRAKLRKLGLLPGTTPEEIAMWWKVRSYGKRR